jgi:hypothetical protein
MGTLTTDATRPAAGRDWRLTRALVNPNSVDVAVRELIEQALDSADPANVRVG